MSLDVEGALHALESGEEAARRRAVGQLGASGQQGAIRPLLVAVGDESWSVRQDAIEALTGFPPKSLLPVLESALREASDAGLRNASMEIYVRLGPPGAAPPGPIISEPGSHAYTYHRLTDKKIPESVTA